jgi:hypothetical protein
MPRERVRKGAEIVSYKEEAMRSGISHRRDSKRETRRTQRGRKRRARGEDTERGRQRYGRYRATGGGGETERGGAEREKEIDIEGDIYREEETEMRNRE